MIKVFLVDDHGIVRAGMQAILEAEHDIQIVGTASGGWQALNALKEPGASHDVVVLDLSMPGMHGTEVLRRLLEHRPETRVLVVSMYAEEEFGPTVIEAGATGYLTKSRADEDLVDAVRTVARGRVFLSREVALQGGKAPHRSLTAREIQVFMLIVDGRQPGDIAAELNLGLSTVSTYIGRIRQKLSVESIADIVHYAYRHGLVGDDSR